MQKEVAKILLKVQMDDLEDAQMLYEYAEEIREEGDEAIAQAIKQRALHRLEQYSECERSITSVLERARAQGEGASEVLYSEICKEYLSHWYDKVKLKIDEM